MHLLATTIMRSALPVICFTFYFVDVIDCPIRYQELIKAHEVPKVQTNPPTLAVICAASYTPDLNKG